VIGQPEAVETAARLMTAFAQRTGLSSARPPRRYLWTDAFAVCNFLALWRETGRDEELDRALRLIDQVHQVLAPPGTDPEREGHPTRGGLRIGKPLPERRPGEPFDERLEWDRDGQYFHYLTKWAHALDQTSRAKGDRPYHLWACELADAAARAFVARAADGRPTGMYWKMSCDLSRPLVATMGHHDPLDGLVTCAALRATPGGPDLAGAVADFAALCAGRDWVTVDPLGLGGLLFDGFRVAQLRGSGAFPGGARLAEILAAAVRGLALYEGQRELRRPASARLAFRELGLAIGLRAVPSLEGVLRGEAGALVDGLARYRPLADAITSCWLDPQSRDTDAWADHRDINDVMLATALLPEGFLHLGQDPPRPRCEAAPRR
jgi:hypothetical protein